MELRATRQMRRNERLDKTAAKKEGPPKTSSKPQPTQQKAPADKLSLSRQALAYLDQQFQQAQEREQRRQARMSDSLSALESSKTELDAAAKRLKIQNKCQRIAARIMRGDRVPPEDLEYLITNDPEGYKLAMAMRRPKEDPEDCESVLDDEDRNGGSARTVEGSTETAPAASAGASSGAETGGAPSE